MKTRILLFAFAAMLFATTTQAQLSIEAANIYYTINFDETVAGICNGQYDGSGFIPTPTGGQLDSDGFATEGMGDGDSDFGDSNSSGDFARGTHSGGTSTGGFYAFTVGSGNTALGVQPTGSDFSPGSITLKVQNNVGYHLQYLKLTYNILVFNNENRSSSFNFAYSYDNVNYTNVTVMNFTTPEAEDASPTWQTTSKNIQFVGADLDDGEFIYFRWISDDIGGSGSRDEFGIDDIVVKAEVPTQPEPTAHPTNFAANATGTTTIENTWTDASIGQAPHGYLILSNLSGIFTLPVDGTAVADDPDMSNGSGALNIIQGTEIANWTGLIPGTQYHYVIFPYTNAGVNIDYKTDGTGEGANATTDTPPSLVINEIHADPASDISGDANGDGVRDTYDDEFVELVNNTPDNVDISGWEIWDVSAVRHVFPDGTVVPANDVIVVFGGGTPTGFGTCLVQTATTGGLSLNNGGDDVTVKDDDGNVVVSLTYGTDAGDNQSITRDPDITGNFVKHTTATGANGALFSPCGRINGDPFVAAYDFVVELKNNAGDFLDGGSLEYREGGGNPWTAATEFSTGEFGINTERTKVGLRMTYENMVQKKGSIPTNSPHTFLTELVTVKLENSSGDGVENGVVDFTSNGWHSFGVTDPDGICQKEMLPLQYTFRMKYDGDKENKKELISSTNNYITFYVDDLKSSEISADNLLDAAVYPNPFINEATIAFSINETQNVSLAILDLNGRLVDLVFDGLLIEGEHRIVWNNNKLKKGFYVCRIQLINETHYLTMVKAN